MISLPILAPAMIDSYNISKMILCQKLIDTHLSLPEELSNLYLLTLLYFQEEIYLGLQLKALLKHVLLGNCQGSCQ